ncbi:MAG: response regulator [Sphingomonadales bacterium]|nr:MAG: response regulator [Sphingomonadales bacterium]
MSPPDPSRLRTILIVDDLEANRELLERSLASAGYRTLSADSGAGALALLTNNAIDLVLLDWMMPGLSGLDTLRAIRQSYSQDALPVIMCTAVGEDENIVEAMVSGANDYVVKPISLPVLRARMATHLSRSATIAALEHERDANVKRMSDQMRRLMEMRTTD